MGSQLRNFLCRHVTAYVIRSN